MRKNEQDMVKEEDMVKEDDIEVVEESLVYKSGFTDTQSTERPSVLTSVDDTQSSISPVVEKLSSLSYVDYTQENYPQEVLEPKASTKDSEDVVSTINLEELDDYCAVEDIGTIPVEEPEYIGDWAAVSEDLSTPKAFSSPKCQVKDIFSVDDSIFCYVETYADKFNVVRLPLEDKREIRRVIGEPSFVCVLPSYVYNDTILGYTEEITAGRACYKVYSANESWSFSVPEEFRKNVAHINMRAYLNNVVNECPLSDLKKTTFPSMGNFTSYSIPSYGVFELRDKNDAAYFFQLKKEFLDFSFFSLALYMRNILDHADFVTVNCLSVLFYRII